MEERTARLSAEADLQSLRAQVTLKSVLPTVNHDALADSAARAVVAARSASRTEPLAAALSRSWTSSGRSELAGTTGQQRCRAASRMRSVAF